MQTCKCHRVADDGYPRIFVTSAKLLIQIASVDNFLRSGLDHDHEKEGKKERRIESVEGENNVSEDPGHDDAESICGKTEKQADNCPAKVHPVPAESKRPHHRPVILKNTGRQEKRDPYAEKVKIHEQKFRRVLISHDCGKLIYGPGQREDATADKLSHNDHNIGQHQRERNKIRPLSRTSCD